MRRSIAAAALLTALALSGLGPPGVAAAQQPPGTDVAECFDGSCTVTVTGPVEIPLDGRVGPTAVSVSEVGTYAVTFRVRSPTGAALAITGPGGTVRFTSTQGTLAVRVLELRDGAAVVELSSSPSGT